MQKVDTAARLLAVIYSRFGRSEIEFFPASYPSRVGTFRVSVAGWHIHRSTGMHGSFFADGPTLLKACKKLLSDAAKYQLTKTYHCTKNCPAWTNNLY